MAAGRLLLPGWMPAVDSNGDPIPNAKVYFYFNKTSTLAPVYSDESLMVRIANPVEANATGRFPAVWADGEVLYSASVEAPYGPAGVPFTYDNLSASLAAEIVLTEAAETAANDAETSYQNILDAIQAAQDADGAAAVAGAIAGQAAALDVVATKANTNADNVSGNAVAWRVAIGADNAANVYSTVGEKTSSVEEMIGQLAVANVWFYGGRPGKDGVGEWIDNTAAFQAAHDALPAEGGTIRAGVGAWGIAGTLNFTKPVRLEVDGGNLGGLLSGFSRLLALSATGDVIIASAGFVMDHVSIDSNVIRTAGAYVKSTGAFISVTHCNFTRHYLGVVADGCSISNINFNNFRNATKSSVSAGGGHIDIGRNNLVVATNIVGNVADTDLAASPNPATGDMCSFGIRMSYTDACIVTHNDIIRSGKDLWLDPQPTQVCGNNYFALNFFDTAEYGIYCAPVAGSYVVRNRFSLNWASGQTARGTILFADSTMGMILGTHFHMHQANINTSDGMLISGENVQETYIDYSLAAGNGGTAINIGENTSKFHITNSRLGPADDFGANAFPIYLGGGNTDYSIRDNDMTGNTNAAYLGTIPSTADVRGNNGFTTKAKGVATIVASATSVVVTHGLAGTPSAKDIMVSMASAPSGVTAVFVSSVGASSFTINVSPAPTADVSIAWQASVENR